MFPDRPLSPVILRKLNNDFFDRVVTTHLYDGVRSLPLDIELYQHATSLPEGKKDKDFVKKPDLALKLIKKTLKRKWRPGIVLIDGGYGNNSRFLNEVEKLNLIYIGGLAKNRKASVINSETKTEEPEKRLDEIAFSLTRDNCKEVKGRAGFCLGLRTEV